LAFLSKKNITVEDSVGKDLKKFEFSKSMVKKQIFFKTQVKSKNNF
jgi:hypothetical protein